ncbi:isochorismate synthase MenF [Pseudolysinimonas yzui]|uniref:isochorismate synthase n=1 Tax=Pseudolysinimonas yzui TaxID=2708254 RepID=A0A8J3GPX8_9MICO|nr:isochorismate synthase [Pseudolysinimonas yzui]GHF13566.1 isochorismate synthase [Pseudolysinimonas yzui]
MTDLTVETRRIDPVPSLIPYSDPTHPLLFLRRGDGIAGIGEALRLEFRGPTRLADAAAAWREVAASARVDDEVRIGGSGLVGFGAFAFDDDSTRTSVLIVPRVVIGRRNGVGWVTRVNGADDAITASPLGAEYRLSLHPGALPPDAYRDAVRSAVGRILSGSLEKVVLARDLVGHVPAGADLRRVLLELALGYPDTWTFAVDGHLGSSPETLVRVYGGDVTARVLAGSHARGADAEADAAAALELATSSKDLDEHRFAVESVLRALRPHGPGITSTELPFTLKLPNLWHLASDVHGRLSDGSGALDLVAALHPTAAVAGTPTRAALDLIRELEPFDRGRYGGPVGWVDQAGDGKWAISLRSAEVDADGTLTAFAGAGIVAESDPDRELAETKLKFRPIVEAFG